MSTPLMPRLFRAYLEAQKARTSLDAEMFEEAVADLRRIGGESTTAAVVSALLMIQIERPILLPLTAVMCLGSLLLLLKRMLA